MKIRVGLLGFFLVLVGCGGLPVQPTEPGAAPVVTAPPVEEAPSRPVEPPQTPYSSNTDGAVDELLSEAIQLRDQGAIDGAIAVTERAVRIAPRSPRVYYVLGTLRLDKGEAEQAMQLALKASSLDSDNFYRRSIDRLIADCEAALGAWK